MACILLIAVVYMCTKSCVPKCHKLVQKLCQKAKNALMFNSILRYFMMTYLGLTTGSCLVIHDAIIDPETADGLSVSLAITILVIFCLMIWPIQRVIFKNKKKLLDPQFRQKYGTLYTPCETHKGILPLLFITIFCVRRLLVAMTCAFLIKQPLL